MGLSYGDIITRLGPPEHHEDYRLNADTIVAFLFYRTGTTELTPAGEDVGLTPVAIGKWGLTSTASTYYHSIARQYPRISYGPEGN